MQTPTYPSISEYGLIGNPQTCALVSRYGSIDWCCFPHVESPSIFAAILDTDQGGRFQIQPVYPYHSTQSYIDRTNILTTEFQVPTGEARLTDWMPFPASGRDESAYSTVYRKVKCTSGTVRFQVEFEPRPEYATDVPQVTETEQGVVAHGDDERLTLSGPVDFVTEEGAARTTVTLTADETVWFVLRYGHEAPHDPMAFQRRLDTAAQMWQQWVDEGGRASGQLDEGRWESLVDRSALTLKLLIHHSMGSIAAAPTTSLPEEIGGTRNWDYRYNWIRDAGMTVQALYKLGHISEAQEYFSWVLSKVYEEPESIQPLYGLHGERDVSERTLDHLEGYRGSAPVRVGNDARHQRQLDIYGELVLAFFQTSKFGEAISQSDWQALCEIIDYVGEVWDEPDSGIWEVRNEPRHFVHSKVMCWAALDRGIRIVENTALDGPIERWRAIRQDIRGAVLEHGYDEQLGSFVQTFETSETLDATALLIPILEFLPIDDHRVQGTIETIQNQLTTSDGLVYRYQGEDGLAGEEGTFVLCSFWLVDALALSGRLEAAEALFGTILSHASPLGLLSEEIASDSEMLLGNYPQAFSHIGLINSVLYLDAARRNRQPGPEPVGVRSELD